MHLYQWYVPRRWSGLNSKLRLWMDESKLVMSDGDDRWVLHGKRSHPKRMDFLDGTWETGGGFCFWIRVRQMTSCSSTKELSHRLEISLAGCKRWCYLLTIMNKLKIDIIDHIQKNFRRHQKRIIFQTHP